jgi:hypothetical protein
VCISVCDLSILSDLPPRAPSTRFAGSR